MLPTIPSLLSQPHHSAKLTPILPHQSQHYDPYSLQLLFFSLSISEEELLEIPESEEGIRIRWRGMAFYKRPYSICHCIQRQVIIALCLCKRIPYLHSQFSCRFLSRQSKTTSSFLLCLETLPPMSLFPLNFA
ncbi:hypothetical protein GBA52_025303 [Prunus armeniaca]|nr:hypothetical protein GBA52_025303 [Prunus armeniaca]